MTDTPQRKPRRFYWKLVLIVGILLFIERFILPVIPLLEQRVDGITDLQNRQLDIFLGQIQLLTSLATLAAGGVGGILLNRGKETILVPSEIRRAVASIVLIGISLYCGHLAQSNIVWMLDKQFFNLSNAHVFWPTRLQFWTFLCAIIVLADFVFASLKRRENEE